MKNSTLFLIPLFVSIFLLSCHFSSHSYNSGSLLQSGDAKVTLASGGLQRPAFIKKKMIQRYESKDTVYANWLSYYCGIRLGILNDYPFGQGMDIGLQVEGSLYVTPKYKSTSKTVHFGMVEPPVLEFDLRAGFPSAEFESNAYIHNIGIGWAVGPWIDNGWFVEYACGLRYKKCIPYSSLRCMITSTDYSSIEDGVHNKYFLRLHNQSINIRNTLGMSILIRRLLFLPDFITPEVSVIYPNYSSLQSWGVAYHIGFSWWNGL